MRIIWYNQLQQHSWTSICVERHTQREVAHHEASMQRAVQEYWGRAWLGEEGRGGQKRSTIQHETVFYVYRILQYACQCTVQVLCTKNIYDKVISFTKYASETAEHVLIIAVIRAAQPKIPRKAWNTDACCSDPIAYRFASSCESAANRKIILAAASTTQSDMEFEPYSRCSK